MSRSIGNVVALAGRRIDAAGSRARRFPLEQVPVVARRLRALFHSLRATTLVCSAANGADLVAIRIAREIGMRYRIILPFSVARFRRVSVTDRPGGELWGWLFDDVVQHARQRGDLIVLRRRLTGDDAAFEAATIRIVAEAARLAKPTSASVKKRLEAGPSVVGIAVWDNKPRDVGDATAMFIEHARDAGLAVRSVRTGS
jgi:hypothetical protein